MPISGAENRFWRHQSVDFYTEMTSSRRFGVTATAFDNCLKGRMR